MQAAELLATGASPEWARGLLSGGYACYAVYATADGRSITVGCVEPHFWARFCERIGRPDLAARQFDVDQAPLFDAVGAIVATRTRDEWTSFFGSEDVCVAPVLSLEEALAAHAGRLVEIDAGGGERVRAPGGLFGETARGASPALGEHTTAILEGLGRTPGEIAALRRRGVT
jgi:crotonobetainyl-CoA:carnitine CoA-transferase CaiB-like acyl-CoA transferase